MASRILPTQPPPKVRDSNHHRARWRRIGAIVSIVAAIVWPCRSAFAQVRSGCTAKVAIGGAIGTSTAELSINPKVMHGSIWESFETRHAGPEWSGRAELALPARWRARFEVAEKSWGVDRELFSQFPNSHVIQTTPAGHVGVTELTLGIGRSQFGCGGYALVGGGLYELRYGGVRVHRPGLDGVLGAELPINGRIAIEGELRIDAVHIAYHGGPFRAYELLSLAASVGAVIKF